MSLQPEAFFLSAEPASGSQRFCLFYPAHGVALRGLVVYVHPFAEEMNKSRRMAALQARALAGAGFDVLQMDLLGCGDSSGDFGDATWQSWVNDVVRGCLWIRDRSSTRSTGWGSMPLWLWGLRAGCLLAVEAASRIDCACNFLFWQPPLSGNMLLQQFLRLKVAGDMLGGQDKGGKENLRQQLANGSPVEVAGYMLSPGLAMGLNQSALVPPATAGQARRLEWFELSTREGASLSPASINTVVQWKQSGFATRSHIARGPAFWQTTEISEAPELIAASTATISASAAAAVGEAVVA
jgi:exosortase A-associated hydrolase 2